MCVHKLLLSSLYTSSVERAVIPAWMPETSHRDVNLWSGIEPKSCPRGIGRLPSLALDSGIPAGMTDSNYLNHKCLLTKN
jgi:hypothetical protein